MKGHTVMDKLSQFIRQHFVQDTSNSTKATKPARIEDEIHVNFEEDQKTNTDSFWLGIVYVKITNQDIGKAGKAAGKVPIGRKIPLIKIIIKPKLCEVLENPVAFKPDCCEAKMSTSILFLLTLTLTLTLTSTLTFTLVDFSLMSFILTLIVCFVPF